MTATQKELALGDCRIVELSRGAAAAFCAKLLADLGAEVVKVEPPSGDPFRFRGPFPKGLPDPEASGLFLYLSTNKSSVTIDLERAGEQALLRRLLEDADALISDFLPPRLADLGLSPAALRERHPGLVIVSVTPFGIAGPHANWKSTPMVGFHASGEGYLLPADTNFLDRPPVQSGTYVADYEAGVGAAVATLGALLWQRATGRGQDVDYSQQHFGMHLNRYYLERFPNEKVTESRRTQGYPSGGVFRCRDGYVVLLAVEEHQWTALVDVMGNPAWTEEARFRDPFERSRNQEETRRRLAGWFRAQPKEAVYHAAQAKGVPIGIVSTPEDLLASPHLKHRAFFAEIDHPVAGRLRYPTAPYRFSETPWRLRRPPPRLGEHNEAARRRRRRRPAGRSFTASRLERPLAGVRVLDFSWAAMGPFCGMLLASFGADVIKVESRRRPDLLRLLARALGWAHGEASLDGSAQFNTLNLGKRSVTLDLTRPEGRELARRLVSVGDVVLESFRPGVMDRFGLGYERLRQVRPDVIMLSCSGWGSAGPEAPYASYGPIFSALGGQAWVTGYPDGPPEVTRLPADMINGAFAAVAVLAAVYYRRRTGRGQHIDYASREGISCLVGEEILGYGMTGETPARRANLDGAMAPHNCYPCRGEDRWVAIAVSTDDEWRSLCRVVGRCEWMEHPGFGADAGRLRHRDVIDRAIADWTRGRDAWDVAERLQAAGVAAFPSATARDLWEDPHLQARDAYISVEHPLLGRQIVLGLPWRFSGMPADLSLPAPLLGQDNEAVFGRLLGLGAEEIERLSADGVIA